MALDAKVIPSDDGLTIQFTATEEDEQRIRSIFDNINDGGDISFAMEIIFNLAKSAMDS